MLWFIDFQMQETFSVKTWHFSNFIFISKYKYSPYSIILSSVFKWVLTKLFNVYQNWVVQLNRIQKKLNLTRPHKHKRILSYLIYLGWDYYPIDVLTCGTLFCLLPVLLLLTPVIMRLFISIISHCVLHTYRSLL